MSVNQCMVKSHLLIAQNLEDFLSSPYACLSEIYQIWYKHREMKRPAHSIPTNLSSRIKPYCYVPLLSKHPLWQFHINKPHQISDRKFKPRYLHEFPNVISPSIIHLDRTTWLSDADDSNGAKPQSETCTSSLSSRRRLEDLKFRCTTGGLQTSCKYLYHMKRKRTENKIIHYFSTVALKYFISI